MAQLMAIKVLATCRSDVECGESEVAKFDPARLRGLSSSAQDAQEAMRSELSVRRDEFVEGKKACLKGSWSVCDGTEISVGTYAGGHAKATSGTAQ
ncbi:hypothetical protein MCOR14_000914 [Pyricularia oryzae]|nr:hypothetical protein MCOR19_006339 [Pyricularia oryzae]KAI6280373.1 hypothetical protein MCOR26_003788 [Pyricularia oryzae]KAI6414596.1 hypothetical protein MCOR20_002108 [Pyricularia oryzae]KAI6478282.1 hypothetical protein MCOR17_000152 [Pyricularia oryzae]KAI6487256.1 hypothetical protein MCOR18_003156 [Pyricularia oryzae]